MVAPSSTTNETTIETLPDLVVNSEDMIRSSVSNQIGLSVIPPIGEKPPDHIFNGTTTEEEFDAVDALLSLSTAWTITSEDIDENASLMPVGGVSQFVDVNPVMVQLDQVTVDGAIAQIVEQEQLEQNTADQQTLMDTSAPTKDNTVGELTLSGVQSMLSGIQNMVSGVQTDSEHPNLNDIYNADTEVEETESEQPKKGYVKVTTHGIKRKSSTDGRSYRCTVCGKRKRSAQKLKEHHRRNHSSQMCGICGKIFDLASTLTHHMYSHDKRRFYCDKCSYHSHFESELKKHKITHYANPSHQCMHRNCGRWFRRKSDLVLHVKTHQKNVIKCEICDHTTTLPKYMKEHMKSHANNLLYKCDICHKHFLWRSGVQAHKQKEHGPSKK